MMDRQRRLKLAHVLKSKDEASAKEVGGSPLPTSNTSPSSPNSRPQPSTTPSTPSVQPSPNQPQHSPPPIAAMPLALAESAAPLDKGKRVVEVVSDDEKSSEGQVFKRKRTTHHAPRQVASATSSSHGAEYLRENPPSATSPPQLMDLEGGVEAEPTTVPPLAPELPLPMQDSMRGFLGRSSPRGKAEGPQRESLYYYMGAFMSCAHS